MKTKFYYKVEPDDLFNYKHIQSQGQGSYKTAIAGFAADVKFGNNNFFVYMVARCKIICYTIYYYGVGNGAIHQTR